jgi:hypothetical protein
MAMFNSYVKLPEGNVKFDVICLCVFPPVWPQYGQKLESSNSASELDLQDRRETQHFKIPRCRARGCRWFVLFGRDVCWLPKERSWNVQSMGSMGILGGSSHLVSWLVHPNYKWINPTYPM